MTDDDESYRTDGGHPSWGVNPRIGKTPDAEANKIAEESYRNITGNPNQKPVIESYDKECQDFTPFPNDCCGFHECIQKDCVYHPDAEKGNPVPSSTELIAMANLEWKNREERRGVHNKEDWCCGWMAGFLTEKKPNWGKEQIGAAEKRGYERALDDLGVLHGEDARKFNEELKNPSLLTPEAAEVMRKARELARK